MLRSLRHIHRVRPQLLELVSRGDRSAKLVHLRSPRELGRWLGSVERVAARSS